MRKLITALVIATIAISLCVTSSSALVAISSEYPSGAGTTSATYQTGGNGMPNIPHPSSGALSSAAYQTFQVSLSGGNLTYVDIYMKKVSAPSAFYRCSVYNATGGTWGTTATPSTLVEDNLEDLQISTLQSNNAWQRFNFSGTIALWAYPNSGYAIVLSEVNETTCDATNYGSVYYDSVGSLGWNDGYFSVSSWTANVDPLNQWCFRVWLDGGDLVTYVGGDMYFDTQTTNYNVTAGTADVALTIQSPTQDLMFYTLLALTFACIILMLKSGIPIINFVFGVMTIGIATYSLQTSTIIFFGYIQMFAMLMATLCMLSGYRSYRND